MITRQQIKYIRSLHQKKFRDVYNCFLAEGLKIVKEAITNPFYVVDLIVYTPQTRSELNFNLLKENTKTIEITSKEFSRISGQKTPQEVLAVLRMNKQYPSLTKITGSIVLALDRIQDPGNLGTILRLADWFGVEDILCSEDCVDCYNPKVIQASMGAFLRVNLQYGKLVEMLIYLKEKQHYRILGTALTGESIYNETYSKKTVIVLGNESNGISESITAVTDNQIMIPNYSIRNEKTESLNVSVAAAIICSEILRREQYPIQNERGE